MEGLSSSLKLIFIFLIMIDGKKSEVKKKPSVNRYDEFRDTNAVLTTMCDARCRGRSIAEREQCHTRCLGSIEPKPGKCPSSFKQLTIFAKACLQVCTSDFQCPYTEKCCQHSCGVTCQPAQHLEDVVGLPPVPVNVTAKEHSGKNVIRIQWSYPASTVIDRATLYLIENRSHFGKFFNEDNFGPWTPFFQATENPATIRGLVMTAHWYIFRIAAVNSNGTKGYSEPSEPILISKIPAKPGPPKRLGVTNIREVNDTIWADLKWKRPKSEIPIKRYRVYWSRRLPGYHPKNASESLLRNQTTLPKNRLSFELRNLEKNELYFIQVQAIAVFGDEKIRGVKGNLFFNTSSKHDHFAERKRRINIKNGQASLPP